jgi:hypothetical protein
MRELVLEYWWVSLFTVPALAFAIRAFTERSGLVDSLPAALRSKLSSFAYSYPEHWVVSATTRDGRRFSRVVISERFQLVSDAALPFRLHDLADVAWEGITEGDVGPAVRLSDGEPRGA